MEILKTEQITVSLITHLLSGYKTIDRRSLYRLTMFMIYGALSRKSMPIFVRDEKGGIFMFIYITEEGLLLKLPISTEEISVDVTKIFVHVGKEKIELMDGYELTDFEEFRGKIVELLPSLETVKLYEVYDPSKFDKNRYIKIFGTEEFDIFKTREKLPKYFLITKESTGELHNLNYKVPLIVENDLGVIAFYGSGKKVYLKLRLVIV